MTIRKRIDINACASATKGRRTGERLDKESSYAALIAAMELLSPAQQLQAYSDFLAARSAKNATRSDSGVDSHSDLSDADP